MVKPTSSSTPLLNSTSLLVKSDDQAGPVDIDMSDSSTSLVPSKLTQAMADYWGEHRKAVLKALFAATIAGSSLGLYIKLTEDSSNFVRASSLTVNSFVNYLSALDTWAYIEGVMDSRNGSARNRCVEGVFAVMCAAIVGLGAMFISLGSAGPDDSMLEKVFFALINAVSNMTLGLMAMKGIKDPLMAFGDAVSSQCGSKVLKQKHAMIRVAGLWQTSIAHIAPEKFNANFSADQIKLILKSPEEMCQFMTDAYTQAETANEDDNKRWFASAWFRGDYRGLALLLNGLGKIILNVLTATGLVALPLMATLSQAGYAEAALKATQTELGMNPDAAFGLTMADQFFNLFLGFIAGIKIVMFLRSTIKDSFTYQTSSAYVGGILGHILMLMAVISSVVVGWLSGLPAQISWDNNCGNIAEMSNQSSSDLSFAPMARWVEQTPFIHPEPGSVVNLGAQMFNTYYMAFALVALFFSVCANSIFTSAHFAIQGMLQAVDGFIEQLKTCSAAALSDQLDAVEVVARRSSDPKTKAMVQAMQQQGVFTDRRSEVIELDTLTVDERSPLLSR